MLMKEYRVCMPLTVEEVSFFQVFFLPRLILPQLFIPPPAITSLSIQYRIGQLYMIARHSAEESKGGGDGVEVVVNESCHDDVHGDGQYTEKRIYLTR